MPKLSVDLPREILDLLDYAVKERLRVYRRAESRKPPVSQLTWLSSTTDGKKFIADCQRGRYLRLTPASLNLVTKQAYYKSYGLEYAKPKTEDEIRDITVAEIRNNIVSQALESLLGASNEASTLININKNK